MDMSKEQLIVAYQLKKKLDAFIRDKKIDLELNMMPGDSTAPKIDFDGQTLALGKITVSDPKYAWKILDPEALRVWAEENMPEIGRTEFVLTEDGAKSLLKMVQERNGAFTDDGEVIPGVKWAMTSTPSVRITPDKGIDDVLSLLASEGRLGELTGFLELEQ